MNPNRTCETKTHGALADPKGSRTLQTKTYDGPTGRKGNSEPSPTENGSPRLGRGRGRRSTSARAGPRPPHRSRNATAGHPRWPPQLSVAEERALAERIKSGDQDARNQLILANRRFVTLIARKYRSKWLSFDDLVQEGNLGLIRASQDFDPAVHESRFINYACVWIKSFVHRAILANASLIRLPEHVVLLQRRYRRAIKALGSPNSSGIVSGAREEPGIEQVARELGVSQHRLEAARLAAMECGPYPEIDEVGHIVALTEAMVDNRRPEGEVITHEVRAFLEAALRQLNPVEAWVLRERYGLDVLIPEEQAWADLGPQVASQNTRDRAPHTPVNESLRDRSPSRRTYVELERDCGLSPHRIRQVERVALEKLRQVLGPWLDLDL